MQSSLCFTVGPNGYFILEPVFPRRQKTTLLGAICDFDPNFCAYDADGRKWQLAGKDSAYQRTWWRVLVANTMYNPWVTVGLLWGEPTHYALAELKRAYLDAIDLDDDNLTQFVDAPELIEKVKLAQSFEEVVAVYRWMATDNISEDAA